MSSEGGDDPRLANLDDFREVAILGPGLLGGSLALALRERGANVRLWARREEAVTEILAAGLVETAATDLEPVLAGADLVVLATPVGVMEEIFERALPLLSPGTVVTDVGSVKGLLVTALDARARDADSGIEFVGSHPMAGSEKTGIEHARTDLFEGAACVVTVAGGTTPSAVARVAAFWDDLGCKVHVLPPGEHDERIAAVSHLPHLAACATALAALGGEEASADLAGAGLRDTTRVAGGDPAMWAEIVLLNREAILPLLRSLATAVDRFAQALEAGDEDGLRALLGEAKKLRDDSLSS